MNYSDSLEDFKAAHKPTSILPSPSINALKSERREELPPETPVQTDPERPALAS